MGMRRISICVHGWTEATTAITKVFIHIFLRVFDMSPSFFFSGVWEWPYHRYASTFEAFSFEVFGPVPLPPPLSIALCGGWWLRPVMRRGFVEQRTHRP